jgi:hypothetical protein
MHQYKNIRFQVWDLGGQSSIRCVLSRPPSSKTWPERYQTVLAVLLPKHVRHYLRYRRV